MSVYSQSVRGTVNTAGTAIWELRPPPKVVPSLLEIGFASVAAVSINMGLGKNSSNILSTVGITNIFTADGEAATPTTALTVGATGWNISPALPLTFYRRNFSAATAGSGIIWTFPQGLGCDSTTNKTTMGLFNITQSALMDIWVSIDE